MLSLIYSQEISVFVWNVFAMQGPLVATTHQTMPRSSWYTQKTFQYPLIAFLESSCGSPLELILPENNISLRTNYTYICIASSEIVKSLFKYTWLIGRTHHLLLLICLSSPSSAFRKLKIPTAFATNCKCTRITRRLC